MRHRFDVHTETTMAQEAQLAPPIHPLDPTTAKPRPIGELEDEITELVANINAATYRFLVLILL